MFPHPPSQVSDFLVRPGLCRVNILTITIYDSQSYQGNTYSCVFLCPTFCYLGTNCIDLLMIKT